MPAIAKVLIANRGEIAVRIIRAARDSGIGSVAVYADQDRDALHTRLADEAYSLDGDNSATTYLQIDKILSIARRAGADAVHPGYGFLSENADFARAVLAAGLTWVGPPPPAIDAMGSKIESKRLMAEAGVPVLTELDPESATESDLPLLVKASAGGGGRGMRIVRTLDELMPAVEAARNEAASAFGDPTVFCEPYLETGRHIEVQVMADSHGTVWALGERECSIQRRHQKVIEEAPSPLVDDDLRARLCEAAVAAAKAVDYVGAGTVEFLADNSGRFFFLEMNTRLQVEHPVTECVTGLDLVALQLRIAEGAPLPDGGAPEFTGHSIEVRLYAENPADNWMPTSGPLHRFEIPGTDAEFRIPADYGLRVDTGFGTGDVIGVHYDAMLAKVITWAPTRAEAARRLATALADSRIHGVTTNRDLLVRVLRHEAFLAGDIDTAFFDKHNLSALSKPLADAHATRLSALAAALAQAEHRHRAARVGGNLPLGWRNVVSDPQRQGYTAGGDDIAVAFRLTRDGLQADGFDGVTLVARTPDSVVLEVSNVKVAFTVTVHGATVDVDSIYGHVALAEVPRFVDPSTQVAAGSLLAPMPAAVLNVLVAAGDVVTAGQPLVVLEAMKMQHTVIAAVDGRVDAVAVSAGDQVESQQVLVVVTDDED